MIERDHAVVVGGGMAGLFAARALSETFDRVTVVERDAFDAMPVRRPDGSHLNDFSQGRRGTPQAFHVHALIYGSRVALDDLYGPTFTQAMRDAGAQYLDMGRDHAIMTAGGWIRRQPTDLMSVYATRFTTENVIRRLTTETPKVGVEVGKVSRLLATTDGARVTGVRLESDAGERSIEADLVVDASGRGSKAPGWIEALGYTPPQEATVNSHLGYATVYCRVPDGAWPGDILSLTATPIPGTTRGVSMNPQEDGLYGLIAVGQNRDYPPKDRDGFTEFLRTAITPLPYEIWCESEQVTDIRTTKTSTNRLRQWHELERLPQRFIAIGDSVAAFNPTYGQGIATAALNARKLRDRLREHDTLDAVEKGVQVDLVGTSQLAWFIATQSDMSFDSAEIVGVDPAPAEADAFFNTLRRLAATDGVVAHAFLKALMSLDATGLGDPDIQRRVAEAPPAGDLSLEDLARPPEYAYAANVTAA